MQINDAFLENNFKHPIEGFFFNWEKCCQINKHNGTTINDAYSWKFLSKGQLEWSEVILTLNLHERQGE